MKIEAYGLMLEVLEDRPFYSLCHPDEKYLKLDPELRCEHCVIAIMPDTFEPVIMWGCGNRTGWGVNRSNPKWKQMVARLWALAA